MLVASNMSRSSLPSWNALLSLHLCINLHNHQSSHPSICPSVKDVAGVVSAKKSAAAGPGQCAAYHLRQDPDACGLSSLVLQGFTQVQSMTSAHPLPGSRVHSVHLPLHAAFWPRNELAACFVKILWFVFWLSLSGESFQLQFLEVVSCIYILKCTVAIRR